MTMRLCCRCNNALERFGETWVCPHCDGGLADNLSIERARARTMEALRRLNEATSAHLDAAVPLPTDEP